MKKIFSILTAAVLSCSALFAQMPVRTAYFLDGYDFRHQMNPALASARSYFIIPALGFVNVGVQSNVGINTFIYPSESGRPVTFMHGSVEYDTFAKKLNKINRLTTDFSTSIISLGAWDKKNGFYTVEINTKVNAAVTLPKDLFSVLKNLGGQSHYDFGKVAARTRAYLEVAVGHSRRINESLTIGAKLKFLLGVADVQANIDRMTVDMDADRWAISSKGSLRTACGFMAPKTYGESGRDSQNPDNNKMDFSSFRPDLPKKISSYPAGYGAAIDLGASYRFESIGLTVSAAVLDLGMITWNNPVYAATGDNTWSFDGFNDISISGGGQSIGNQFSSKFKEFTDNMLTFYKEDGKKTYTDILATTITAGAEYTMPFFKPMSVSALFTSRIQKTSGWAEGRVAVNFAFGNCFGLSASYALSTFGSSFGAALNLHCKGISFYVATDSIPMRYAKTPLKLGKNNLLAPLGDLNLTLNAGLVFNVSNRRDKEYRE